MRSLMVLRMVEGNGIVTIYFYLYFNKQNHTSHMYNAADIGLYQGWASSWTLCGSLRESSNSINSVTTPPPRTVLML